MPFQKGRRKTGGRRAGIKYRSIRQDLAEMLDDMGHNPFVGMANIAMDSRAPVAVRAHCNAQLAKYLKPQLKTVELSGAAGGPIRLEVEAVREFMKQAGKDGE